MTKTEDKKLLALWREKVMNNAGNRCEIDNIDNCLLNAHHYIGRRNRSTRYYIPNGICLSASRHTMGIESAHNHPEYFRAEMLDRRGDKWLEDLNKQYRKVFKGTFIQVNDYLNGKTKNYC